MIGERREIIGTARESRHVGLPLAGGAIDAVEDRRNEIVGVARPQHGVTKKAWIVAIFAALSKRSMAGGTIALKQLGAGWITLLVTNSVLAA